MARAVRVPFRSVWFKLRVGRDRQVAAPFHGTRTKTSGTNASGESVVYIISFLMTGNVEAGAAYLLRVVQSLQTVCPGRNSKIEVGMRQNCPVMGQFSGSDIKFAECLQLKFSTRGSSFATFLRETSKAAKVISGGCALLRAKSVEAERSAAAPLIGRGNSEAPCVGDSCNENGADLAARPFVIRQCGSA
ncbi:hypothetical protein DFR48_103367 [Ciceribacter lividus]|uniref:Uncharacterized protein n=1 Tax=Ciceribacter lividus TaxID=1197950 RepID=A0A6I7HRU2_9HYPH|nr:hypothetical protein DFR48_103367 [Ciceribacter lividus]